MKKYVLILLILISVKAFSSSTFPDSNAIWNVNIEGSGPIKEVLYGLKGDTLINDTIYNKLYTLSDTTLSNENMKDYIGGFRQEGQKVWFKPAYWTEPNILLSLLNLAIAFSIFFMVSFLSGYDTIYKIKDFLCSILPQLQDRLKCTLNTLS